MSATVLKLIPDDPISVEALGEWLQSHAAHFCAGGDYADACDVILVIGGEKLKVHQTSLHARQELATVIGLLDMAKAYV